MVANLILDPLLRGVGVPVAVTTGILLAAGQPWRRGEVRARTWAAAAASGSGFVAGYAVLFGWPKLPPGERWQWLAYAGAAALIVGLCDVRLSRAGWQSILIRIVACAGASLALVPDFQDLAETRWLWVAGVAAVSLATWTVLTAGRDFGVGPVVLLVLSAACGAFVLALFSNNARLGQLAGVLLSVWASGFAVAIWRAGAVRVRGLAPLAALVFPGLMFNGRFYDYSDVPTLSFILPVVAPLVAGLLLIPAISGLRAYIAVLICIAAALVPIALALGLAVW